MPLETHFGIPRAFVVTAEGKKIDLTAFVGHPLILACCPSGKCSVTAFLQDLSNHAERLSSEGAWTVGITDDPLPPGAEKLRLLVASDPDGGLHSILGEYLREQGADLAGGAVFLFSRGGSLQHYWVGHPDAEEVVEEVARRR